VTGAGLTVVVPLLVIALQSVCGDADFAALVRAQEQIARGDEGAARAAVEGDTERCTQRRLADLALRGWAEARALAPLGGAVDLQGPVRKTLDELRALAADAAWSVDVEYADAVIRAAIAAAQDERPEMELLLTHARDLAERLQVRERRALWPRPFNIVAGELWFEVDRYADAEAAYERAVRGDASPLALVGLARALARQNRWDEACAAYGRVSAASATLRSMAEKDLAPCQ
jgi:tetratricopeptide (TPR) repeat protein